MSEAKLKRLRVVSLIEGLSLVLLLSIAVPAKYLLHSPMLVRVIGPIHGVLFLLFVFMTITAAIEASWKFRTTAVILLSSVLPFGCFYTEKKIFPKLSQQ